MDASYHSNRMNDSQPSGRLAVGLLTAGTIGMLVAAAGCSSAGKIEELGPEAKARITSQVKTIAVVEAAEPSTFFYIPVAEKVHAVEPHLRRTRQVRDVVGSDSQPGVAANTAMVIMGAPDDTFADQASLLRSADQARDTLRDGATRLAQRLTQDLAP